MRITSGVHYDQLCTILSRLNENKSNSISLEEKENK